MKYLILGAGPAGLTFANKLLERGETIFSFSRKRRKREVFAEALMLTAALLIQAADISLMLRIRR